jgi:hypothetical protein
VKPPLGRDDFGGGDGLADVALGVVGDVDEEAAEGSGKALTAHPAGLVEVGMSKLANAGGASDQRRVEFGEKLRAGADWFEFAFMLEDLFGGEGAAFSVGKKAVQTAGDVAQVEGYWGEGRRASVELRIGEQTTVMMKIHGSEFQGMENGAGHGGKFGEGAAEPGFWERSCWWRGVRHWEFPLFAVRITQDRLAQNGRRVRWV